MSSRHLRRRFFDADSVSCAYLNGDLDVETAAKEFLSGPFWGEAAAAYLIPEAEVLEKVLKAFLSCQSEGERSIVETEWKTRVTEFFEWYSNLEGYTREKE